MSITQAPSASRLSGVDGSLFTLLLLVDSLHLVFARAFLPFFEPVVSATLVLLVALIQVGIYGFWRGELHLSSLRNHFWFYLAIGFLVWASTALNYSAVAFIDVGTASMLAKTSTLFSIGIGLWWLRERLHPLQLVGAVLAFAGVLIITFQPGDLLRWGALMVLASTIMYALHAALVKRYGNSMGFVDFFFFRLLFTTLTLGAITLTRPLTITATPSMWLLLVVAGTVDVVISRALYYQALRRLPMSLHAIILTLSPVVTVGWSYMFFSTFPGFQQLLGGVIVVAGVTLAAFFRKS